MSFGENLKYYRELAGFTQLQISEKIDISLNQYQKYEHDKNFPHVDKLIKICKILDVPADYLLSDKGKIHLDYSNAVLLKEFAAMDDGEAQMFYQVLKRIYELKKTMDR